MKLVLIIVSILGFLASHGDCAPNHEKVVKKTKKSVRFNDKPSIIIEHPQADPDGCLIFHMNGNDFQDNAKKKSDLYGKASTEQQFLRAIAIVINCNYLMYERLYGYMNGLVIYDTELCQIEIRGTERGASAILFPNATTFEQFVNDKQFFKQKLVLLLSWLEPSYKMNENLLKMMDSMKADTKIDPKLRKKMVYWALKVNAINKIFEKVFNNFPMDSYRNHLDLMRKLTLDLEFGKIVLITANHHAKIIVGGVNKICPRMKGTMRTALQINIEDLYVATKRVHDIVMEALKVDEGVSSESVDNGNGELLSIS